MSRFDQEWALVPSAARWLAVLLSLGFVALMAAIFLLPAFASGNRHALWAVVPIFLVTLCGIVPPTARC